MVVCIYFYPPRLITKRVSTIHSPVLEALFVDEGRHPVGLGVVLEQFFSDGLNRDKPGGHRLVDQGCVRPPAEGVAVEQMENEGETDQSDAA